MTPAQGPVGEQRATWLRFLIREVVAPRSVEAVARAGLVGLGVRHRVDGTALFEAPGEPALLVSVRDNRVSVARRPPPPARVPPDPRPVQHERRTRRRRPEVVVDLEAPPRGPRLPAPRDPA